MSKITLDTVASGYDLSKINANFALIQAAFDNTLSRDGTSPNSLSADLDLNGQQVINELASTGEGFVWEGAWVTATSYELNNLVSENGSTYICTETHTSGTFATDLAANKWAVVASKGATGGGTGDLVAANNLSDVANVATARTNLGAQAALTAASQGEMEAGTEATIRSMSPLRVAQAIAALAGNPTLVRTTFTASGNLTFPAGVTQAWVTGQASGGGGGGSTIGTAGGNLTFGPNGGAVVLTLTGGNNGGAYSGITAGAGGTGAGSGVNQGANGRNGQYKTEIGGGVNPQYYANSLGGQGGVGMFGNLGSGGNGGDGTGLSGAGGGGGGAGEQCFSFPVTVTAAQWDVIIGSAGAAGTASGSGTAPQAGKGGFFIVEYLQ